MPIKQQHKALIIMAVWSRIKNLSRIKNYMHYKCYISQKKYSIFMHIGISQQIKMY